MLCRQFIAILAGKFLQERNRFAAPKLLNDHRRRDVGAVVEIIAQEFQGQRKSSHLLDKSPRLLRRMTALTRVQQLHTLVWAEYRQSDGRITRQVAPAGGHQ
ncbi:hypothetical protein AWB67_05900 [Caballeronia terrestris]|uniref:Uncharacterized protein n=2 Tax=Caballeronia terrestris TaxID=1226301 RepID=A0A158KKK1_9BURK|nr:hypothetical protein AWB67_05900 [Caballeronia terrestris]